MVLSHFKRIKSYLSRLIEIPNQFNELLNEVRTLENLTRYKFASIEQLINNNALNSNFNSGSPQGRTEISLIISGLLARHMRLKNPSPCIKSNYQAAKPVPMEVSLEKLRSLHPKTFLIWSDLFENGKRSYYELREASCSHRTHRYALLFGAYVEIYSFGRILDIGCGPHGLPSYLAMHDPSLISGLDPLEPTGKISFEYVRGFNEFLPWPDNSFHTILSATALDHVLSLDASLQEVRRVLAAGGRYLVWLASVPGATPYDPDKPDLGAIDDYHMFHFNRDWIEPIFERYFEIQDITIISQPGFDHVFYCMSAKS